MHAPIIVMEELKMLQTDILDDFTICYKWRYFYKGTVRYLNIF